MLQMQHFMEHDVFDHKPWNPGMIENAADHDGVVRWVIVAETVAGVSAAPGELWTPHQPVEEAAVSGFEEFFPMGVVGGGGGGFLSSAGVAGQGGPWCGG